MEAAKVGSARGLASSGMNGASFGGMPAGAMAGGVGSRIAKPLRGGGGSGGAGEGGLLVPTLANLQAGDGGARRMSWWRG